MLDQSTRATILKLHQQGHSLRGIARALKRSRGAVREVLRSATESVPSLVREEKATPYRDQILELYPRCKGNLVRVPRRTHRLRGAALLSGVDRLLSTSGDRPRAPATRRGVYVPTRPGDAARYLPAPRRDRQPTAPCRFQAHEKGDANRSARVERAFRYVPARGTCGPWPWRCTCARWRRARFIRLRGTSPQPSLTWKEP